MSFIVAFITLPRTGCYQPRKNRDLVVPYEFTFAPRACAGLKDIVPRTYELYMLLHVGYIHLCRHLTAHQGLPQSMLRDADQQLPKGYGIHDRDVFALIKERMHSDTLCQKPLLVWPGNDLNIATAALYTAQHHRGIIPTVDYDRSNILKQLAKFLETYPEFERACAYIRMLSGEVAKSWARPPQFDFLNAGPSTVRMHRPSMPLAEPIPTGGVHRMVATFGRR